MILDNLQFHNVAEVEPIAGQPGLQLRRFPKAVRNQLSPLGRMVADDAAGCEIRFVTESTHVRLALSALPSPLGPYEQHSQDVAVFNGPFFHSMHRIATSGVSHIQLPDIGAAQKMKYAALPPAQRHGNGFSVDVWRICLGRYTAGFHGLESYGFPVRPPVAGEVPRLRWLAYGSSITNGAAPTAHHLSYIYHAARALGVDVYNQGLSGSCHCEPEIADYFARRDDWDIATLEIGVNMRLGTTPTEFRERSSYLIRRLIEAHPQKTVAVITIFPNAELEGFTADPKSELCVKQRAFCEILRETVATLKHPHLHLIEGTEILTDFSALTRDLIHPGDYGHIQMGYNLANRLRAIIK